MTDRGGITYDTVMLRIVLDTNVVYSGLYSRAGAAHRVLRALGTGRFDLVLSVPLLLEYEAVLRRDALSLGLTVRDVESFLDYVSLVASHQAIHFLWRPVLGDVDDDMLLELAVAGGCAVIVTHNGADFAGAERFGIGVLSPGEFLRVLGHREPGLPEEGETP